MVLSNTRAKIAYVLRHWEKHSVFAPNHAYILQQVFPTHSKDRCILKLVVPRGLWDDTNFEGDLPLPGMRPSVQADVKCCQAARQQHQGSKEGNAAETDSMNKDDWIVADLEPEEFTWTENKVGAELGLTGNTYEEDMAIHGSCNAQASGLRPVQHTPVLFFEEEVEDMSLTTGIQCSQLRMTRLSTLERANSIAVKTLSPAVFPHSLTTGQPLVLFSPHHFPIFCSPHHYFFCLLLALTLFWTTTPFDLNLVYTLSRLNVSAVSLPPGLVC